MVPFIVLGKSSPDLLIRLAEMLTIMLLELFLPVMKNDKALSDGIIVPAGESPSTNTLNHWAEDIRIGCFLYKLTTTIANAVGWHGGYSRKNFTTTSGTGVNWQMPAIGAFNDGTVSTWTKTSTPNMDYYERYGPLKVQKHQEGQKKNLATLSFRFGGISMLPTTSIPTGSIVYVIVEVTRDDSVHPVAPYARLPKFPVFRDQYEVNQVAIKLQYKDPQGQHYSHYCQASQVYRDRGMDCFHGYALMLGLKRHLERVPMDNPDSDCFEKYKIAQSVREVTWSHMRQAYVLLELPVQRPKRVGVRTNSEKLQDLLSQINFVNFGVDWPDSQEKMVELTGAPQRKRCDICYGMSDFIAKACRRTEEDSNVCYRCAQLGVSASWTASDIFKPARNGMDAGPMKPAFDELLKPMSPSPEALLTFEEDDPKMIIEEL